MEPRRHRLEYLAWLAVILLSLVILFGVTGLDLIPGLAMIPAAAALLTAATLRLEAAQTHIVNRPRHGSSATLAFVLPFWLGWIGLGIGMSQAMPAAARLVAGVLGCILLGASFLRLAGFGGGDNAR